jgi:hypothetical protein
MQYTRKASYYFVQTLKKWRLCAAPGDDRNVIPKEKSPKNGESQEQSKATARAERAKFARFSNLMSGARAVDS